MDLVVVYKSNPGSYLRILQALRDQDFNPVALEDPSSDAVFIPKGGYRRGAKVTVYIAVPRDEKYGAISALRKWDQARHADVRNLSRTLTAQLLFSLLIVIAAASLLLLFDIWQHAFPVLFITWFASFILIANAGKIIKK